MFHYGYLGHETSPTASPLVNTANQSIIYISYRLVLPSPTSSSARSVLNISLQLHVTPGEHVWVNLRFFGASWYDSLPIEDKHLHDYYVEFIYRPWSGSAKHSNHWITATCPILGFDYTKLGNYFVYAYGSLKNPPAEHL